jgi:predicted ester cyclase
LIDCKTSKFDEVNRLLDTWIEQSRGKRTATHSVLGKDRSDSTHVIEIVEFPSYEEAMRNSQLPETDRTFREMVALCDEMPTFTDLDVIRDEQLNKETARRYFEEVVGKRAYGAAEELCTADYQEHDPANERDPLPLKEAIQSAAKYLDAFQPISLTVEGQVAEGDLVTTRWVTTGTHAGEFMGVEPSGKELTVTGHTTQRFREGKISEAWWHWDLFGLLSQLGVIEQ